MNDPIVVVFGTLAVMALFITVPMTLWRMNMAMNDPEKYQRLRAFEEDEAVRKKKAVSEIAGVVLKVGGKALNK